MRARIPAICSMTTHTALWPGFQPFESSFDIRTESVPNPYRTNHVF